VAQEKACFQFLIPSNHFKKVGAIISSFFSQFEWYYSKVQSVPVTSDFSDDFKH